MFKTCTLHSYPCITCCGLLTTCVRGGGKEVEVDMYAVFFMKRNCNYVTMKGNERRGDGGGRLCGRSYLSVLKYARFRGLDK